MNIIKKFFNLFKIDAPQDIEEIYAQDIMLHRIKCKFLYLTDTDKEIEETILSSTSSTLPVCDENSDDIVGCYNTKNYLKDRKNPELFSSKQNVIFVPAKTDLKSILDYLYNKKFNLLVVVDGYGGTQGIITEEILWQSIYKELFVHESFIPIEGSFILSGETLFEDVTDFLFIEDFNQLKSHTIGGLIMEYLSKVPKSDETFIIGSYEIKIIDSNATTIKKLSITPLKKQ